MERANRTLQDRLVKELRLAGNSDMEAGNTFLSGFMERYNAKFAKPPRRPDNLHRALDVEPDRLRDVQLAFSYDRRRTIPATGGFTNEVQILYQNRDLHGG